MKVQMGIGQCAETAAYPVDGLAGATKLRQKYRRKSPA